MSNNNSHPFYAPVVIPTLCRHEHLRRCIESLAQCTGASCTDVYIGLDYPLNDSHRHGWELCNNYLTQLEHNHPFKKLTVIRRTKNYGLGFDGNHWNLVRMVLEKYDKFIFSEDDNIFSAAFLQFINKGLEKFKEDKSIFAINGYRHFYNLQFSSNNFYRQNIDFSAWGFGMWKDRFELTEKHITTRYLRKKALNPKTWFKIARNGNNRFRAYLYGLIKGLSLQDNSMSVDMAINEMDVIMPSTSLVRNMGWDQSGEHCKNHSEDISIKHLTQEISSDSDFEFSGSGWEFYAENHKAYIKQSYGKISLGELLYSPFKLIAKRLSTPKR